MKTNTSYPRVPTRFGRAVRFELKPRFRRLWAEPDPHAFEHLKARLLAPVLSETASPGLRRQLELAANEAAAVAWTTPFPLLVLPELLEEKAAEIRQYAVHQEQVQQASPVLVPA